MKRRTFIGLLSGAAAWPLAARAQQATRPIVGFLHQASPENYGPFVTAFRKGLAEIGYVEGQSIDIEYRWAEGHYDHLASMPADLARKPVVALCAAYYPAALQQRQQLRQYLSCLSSEAIQSTEGWPQR